MNKPDFTTNFFSVHASAECNLPEMPLKSGSLKWMLTLVKSLIKTAIGNIFHWAKKKWLGFLFSDETHTNLFFHGIKNNWFPWFFFRYCFNFHSPNSSDEHCKSFVGAVNPVPIERVYQHLALLSPSMRLYSNADAPEIISINSRVMTACRVRLNVSVSLSIISPAFFDALSMAVMRDDCSEQALSFIA